VEPKKEEISIYDESLCATGTYDDDNDDDQGLNNMVARSPMAKINSQQ
jgi:hypothetical protein